MAPMRTHQQASNASDGGDAFTRKNSKATPTPKARDHPTAAKKSERIIERRKKQASNLSESFSQT